MKYLKFFESFLINEKTLYGGIDPTDIYKLLRDKNQDSYKKVKETPVKEIYLSDLLDTNEGRELLDNYSEGLIKLIKEMNIKINLKKVAIDHPKTLLTIKNTLMKNGLLTKEDLINAKAFNGSVIRSQDWSDEIIIKLDKTDTLLSLVNIIRDKVK